ncbi:hypothetical protein QGP82_05775 [Leptothoe sp. LEGE 181152]|nr:hypothetical protein [Adonisia turfae]MDV3348188.1 hypothetical protein [Leptothoe sp. LEGE 181152]
MRQLESYALSGLNLFGRVDIQPEEYILNALIEAFTSALNN